LGRAVTVTATVGGTGILLTVMVCTGAVIGVGGLAVTPMVYGVDIAVVEPVVEIGLIGGGTIPLPVVDVVVV
jgi:hypothetical protein